MRPILLLLGVPDMPTTSLALLAVMVALSGMMFGWLSDTLFGDGAFGILANTVLLVVGAAIGAMAWRRFGFPISGLDTHAVAGVVSLSGGIGFLILTMIVRRRV